MSDMDDARQAFLDALDRYTVRRRGIEAWETAVHAVGILMRQIGEMLRPVIHTIITALTPLLDLFGFKQDTHKRPKYTIPAFAYRYQARGRWHRKG